VFLNPAFPVYAGYPKNIRWNRRPFRKLSDRSPKDAKRAGSLGQDVAG
jgi:hypothetical protein